MTCNAARFVLASFVALGLVVVQPAYAEERTLCVFDPAGRAGDYFGIVSTYATRASAWGVQFDTKPYTDEETAAKDYQAGHCDAVVATGTRLQRFNRFASTIEAIGALPTYDMLRDFSRMLVSSPNAVPLLTADEHVVVGFLPVGSVYLFVRDRNIDTVAEMSGKRVATLSYDDASKFMVDHVGAIIVPADLGSLGPKFNNGDVDACYVSAPAYEPFELRRGLGDTGGILRAPLAQATLQVMMRSDRFSADFLENSRKELLAQFDRAMAIVHRAESGIPDELWIDVPQDTLTAWDSMFQQVRVQLRDQKQAYDPTMLSALKRQRCDTVPGRAECAEHVE